MVVRQCLGTGLDYGRGVGKDERMRFRVVVAGSDAVAIGRRACQLLDQGHSEPDVVNSMIQQNAGFSTDASTTFTQIAESSYCPQHIGGSAGTRPARAAALLPAARIPVTGATRSFIVKRQL
jgi:hypothetical protein